MSTPSAVPGTMRPRTRSAGKPKTPISSEARMTRLVTLSSAKPRKPLTSPAAIQRGARGLAGVGGGAAGEELPRLLADTLGQRRAPRELAATLRDHVVLELHQRARLRAEAQPRGVETTLSRLVVLQHRLDARVLTLGVRVEEHPQPALHVVIRAAGKHARIVAARGRARGRRTPHRALGARSAVLTYRLGRARRRLRCRRALRTRRSSRIS